MNAEKITRFARTGIRIIVGVSITISFFMNAFPGTVASVRTFFRISDKNERKELPVHERTSSLFSSSAENNSDVVIYDEDASVSRENTAAADASFSEISVPLDTAIEEDVSFPSGQNSAESAANDAPVLGVNSATSEYASAESVTSPDVQQPSPSGLININTATAEQLMTLKGIGEVKSQAIIDYRNTYGAFRNVDQLVNVNGIGEKTLEKIRRYITV